MNMWTGLGWPRIGTGGGRIKLVNIKINILRCTVSKILTKERRSLEGDQRSVRPTMSWNKYKVRQVQDVLLS